MRYRYSTTDIGYGSPPPPPGNVRVPTNGVTAPVPKILQYVYGVSNSSTEDTSPMEDLHKKLITNGDSHCESFQRVSMSIPLLNSLF